MRGSGRSCSRFPFALPDIALLRRRTLLRRAVFLTGSSHAFLPRTNHRRHLHPRSHLASDCDSPYHLPRVNPSSNQTDLYAGEQKKNAPGIIAIMGPTASGKSALAIALALSINGEVINCDSVQVY